MKKSELRALVKECITESFNASVTSRGFAPSSFDDRDFSRALTHLIGEFRKQDVKSGTQRVSITLEAGMWRSIETYVNRYL